MIEPLGEMDNILEMSNPLIDLTQIQDHLIPQLSINKHRHTAREIKACCPVRCKELTADKQSKDRAIKIHVFKKLV